MKNVWDFHFKPFHLSPFSLSLNNKTSALQIVTICMAKNEQDVIEPFLRHNSQFSDLIILIDNSSTDDTKKIALNTARELGNIVVTDFVDPAYNQSATMSQALRYTQSAAFADFIFFLDADEFLQVESKDMLCATLSSLSPRTIGLLPWKTFVPNPHLEDKSDLDPLERMTLLRINEEYQFYKAVLRLSGKLDPSLCVFQGNHVVINAYGSDLPSKIFENVAVAHIPVRSSEQLLAKGAVGWRANIRRKDFKPDLGFHWQRFHDLAEAGENLSAYDLAMEALNYSAHKRKERFDDNVIEARPHLTIARRYSNGKYSSVEKLVDDYERNTTLMVPPFPLPPRPSAMDDAPLLDKSLAANWQWDNLLLDETPFRFLIDFFQPSSILDLGCGIGLYPLLYRHLGVKTVIGVDNIPIESTVLDQRSYINADLQQPFNADHRFDMMICLDVAQQIHPVHRDTFFDNIDRNANDLIIFSMAGPDQPGNENINCMSVSEVLQLWAERGWRPDLPLTLGLRAICSLQSLRRNILVLRRDADHSLIARSALEMIGAKKYNWYDEEFGQRYYAFSEKYPDFDQGYGSSFMVTKFVESLTVKWRSFRRSVVRKLRSG